MTRRQTATAVFIVLCVVLVAAAVSLNVGWILQGERLVTMVLGAIAFALIIAGIIVYTVFLVRELSRTEAQDSFLNAVTHELKTPIASIRLYLETLQAREISEAQRQEFYRVMLDDTTRLQYTVEQVLRAGVAGQRRKLMHRAPVDLGALAVECIETVRRRHHLAPEVVSLTAALPAASMLVEGDVDELRIAIGNLLDNAVKYSADAISITVELAVALSRHAVGARTRPRRRHPAPPVAPHLQPLLPLPGPRLERQGHRARALHGAIDRPPARRPGVRRERGRGPRRHLHAGAAEAGAAGRVMSRILVVEDEQHLADGLKFNLAAEGHEVDVIGDGNQALTHLQEHRDAYDAVVLDVMLPGRNGFDVARALRADSDFVPILMLTARGRPEDVLAGFESGADDYLPKPFELAILLARVRGLLRRKQWLRGPVQASPVVAPPPGAADVLEFAGHRLDMRALELHANGRAYRLTVMEADLLAYFVRHAGAVVSRKTLLDDVWGLHEDTDTRAIDNFIVRLRRYLERDPARPTLILTVRGVGYKLHLAQN